MQGNKKSELPFISAIREGVVLDVIVQPRASKDEIAGLQNNRLKVRITAPPVEGKANKACEEVIANFLGLPRKLVVVHKGHKSRQKRILILGFSLEEVKKTFLKKLPVKYLR